MSRIVRKFAESPLKNKLLERRWYQKCQRLSLRANFSVLISHSKPNFLLKLQSLQSSVLSSNGCSLLYQPRNVAVWLLGSDEPGQELIN